MHNEKTNTSSRPLWLTLVALFAILFGLLTIKEGGTVLFTEQGKVSAGHYVPFVLWFNFIAGFFYVLAGIAMFRGKSCVKKLSAVIAGSNIIIFLLLGIYIFNGGLYEQRTVIAMTARSLIWISITLALFRSNVFKTVECNC